MSKLKKGFIHIIILVVVVVAVTFGIGYFAYENAKIQPKADSPLDENSPNPPISTIDTSDWKPYTSNLYGFTVSYPAEWNTRDSETSSLPIWFSIEPIEKSEGEVSGVWINILDNPQKLSSDSWWNNDIKQYGIFQNLLTQTSREKQIFLGYDAYFVQSSRSKDWHSRPFTTLYISKDSKIYEISTNFEHEGQYFPFFDQILSTFKFLDQNSENPAITFPVENSKVSSPLRIEGSVPAGWMFEGVFPIKLLDENRNLIAQGRGQESIPGSWQSGNPSSFEGKVIFTTDAKSGFLVLENDNPSGLPENSKSYEIPISF